MTAADEYVRCAAGLSLGSFTASGTTADQIVQLDVSVFNVGQAVSGPFRIHILADTAGPPTAADMPLLTLDVASIASGAGRGLGDFLPGGTLSAGPHTLWALADRQGLVVESNETNNSRSASITLGAGPAATPTATTGPTPTFTPTATAALPTGGLSVSITAPTDGGRVMAPTTVTGSNETVGYQYDVAGHLTDLALPGG